jgi:catechol 2,3-dioxygenase
LQISDAQHSREYYGSVLGLAAHGDSLVTQDGTPLVTLHERRGARAVPQAGVLGLYHFAILLPDRAALGRFVRHIGRLQLQFGAADHLVSEAIYLWDPDGLGIEVYADRPRDEWRVRQQELEMATDPLDYDSLLAAAGTEEWNGMPAGTRMGHMHLQVSDLESARAFYHATLGLDIMVWSYPGALFLAAGGYHHHLGINTWARRARPADDNDAQLLDWELIVPHAADVSAAQQALERAGHATESAAGQLVVRDPSGTRLRLKSTG